MLHPTATTIAIGSAKGGAGKTTTALAVADALAARGVNVAVVDLDISDPNLARVAGVDETFPVTVDDTVTLTVPVTDTGVAVLGPEGFEKTPNESAMVTLAGYLDADVVIVDLPPGIGDAHADVARVGIDGWLVVAVPSAVGLAGHTAHLAGLRDVLDAADKHAAKRRDKRRKHVTTPVEIASAETCGYALGTLDGTTVTIRRWDAAADDDVAAAFDVDGVTHLGTIGATTDDDRINDAGIVAVADWVDGLRSAKTVAAA